MVWALRELNTGKGLQHEEWWEKDGLVLYQGRIYVPPNGQLRHDIVKAHHNQMDTLVYTIYAGGHVIII